MLTSGNLQRAVPGVSDTAIKVDATPSNGQSLRRVLSLLDNRFSMYHPKLAESLGDAKTALLLGRALSWTRLSLQKSPELKGWIWQTADQFEADTGLSRFEQSTVRQRLQSMGLWQEQRAGMPARLHFQVNLDALATQLSANAFRARSEWSWEPDTIRDLLGARPVIVYHRLVNLVGDALTGLYLSQLLGQLRADLNSGKRATDYAHVVGIELTRQRVALSRKMQRRCRNILIKKQILVESYTSGLSPRLVSDIDLNQLARLLTAQLDSEIASVRPSRTQVKALQLGLELGGVAPVATLQTARKPIETYSVQERATPDCGNPAIKDVETPHPVVALSLKQDCTELQHRTDPNFKTSFEEAATTYTVLKKEVLKETYLHQSTPASDPVTPFRTGSRRFLYDLSELRGLAPSETIEIDRLAQHAGERGQVLVDELAWAQRNTLRPVGNPVAYLFALVKKHKAGTFIPTGAGRLEALRQRQREDAEAIAAKVEREASESLPAARAKNSEASERFFASFRDRRAMRGAA